MIVMNKTNGAKTEALAAFSLLPQIRGLMFRSKPVSILFDFHEEAVHPIHSLFVFFPFYRSESTRLNSSHEIPSRMPSSA